jgi:hypothetical protein
MTQKPVLHLHLRRLPERGDGEARLGETVGEIQAVIAYMILGAEMRVTFGRAGGSNPVMAWRSSDICSGT